MINDALRRKEAEALEFIRKGARLATDMGNSVEVAFSGGKDSVVLLDLVRKSGIDFTARMNVTGCDTPELMQFVRKEYPEVTLLLPKKTMYQLIVEQGMLPTRIMRYCCRYLKESRKRQGVTILGIRAAESVKRSKRSPIEKKGRRGASYTFDDDESEGGGGGLFDNVTQKTAESCLGLSAGDEILISPIFDWSEADVWNYIRGYNLKYCKLYDEGYHRLGCIMCPMKSPARRKVDMERYPLFVERVYLRGIRTLMDAGKFKEFESAEDVLAWWLTDSNPDEYFAKKKEGVLF